MDHSDRTVQFLHRQMAQGHRLQDPRTKACTLWNAMSRTAHLFDCLWRSEPDPDRFENLRERVFVVHTDAKTKLKALELFVKLQQTRRQRPHESQQSQSKPCHPALPTPITQESVTYDASITDTIGRPTGQAVPDLRGTNVANASRELDMACGMSPKPDKHVKQNHTVQIIGQNRWLPTNRDPNLARRTRHHNETQYPTSRTGNHTELESYLTNDCYYVGQFPLHPDWCNNFRGTTWQLSRTNLQKTRGCNQPGSKKVFIPSANTHPSTSTLQQTPYTLSTRIHLISHKPTQPTLT